MGGELSETFRLSIESQLMFTAQNSGLHHSRAHCLLSLETKFKCRDAFRHKMTMKVLEHPFQ